MTLFRHSEHSRTGAFLPSRQKWHFGLTFRASTPYTTYWARQVLRLHSTQVAGVVSLSSLVTRAVTLASRSSGDSYSVQRQRPHFPLAPIIVTERGNSHDLHKIGR